MSTVIFDIDGTLADCTHRLKYVTGRHKNWDAFFAGIPDDEPIAEIVRLAIDLEFCGYEIVCCTGRGEEYRESTEKQLFDFSVPYDKLYMRPAGDYRPDHVIKKELLDQIKADGYTPWLVIDDRQSVVDMWRENGLMCLQCQPNEPHTYPETAKLVLLVGPSGAGKSTWISKGSFLGMKLRQDMVISSDQTRQDLTGDFRDQSANEATYQAIHAVVKTRLRHGLTTVVDATNIRRKDRVQLATLCPVPVLYVVIDRPMEEKLRDGGWRLDVKIGDKNLIEKHDEVFRSNLKDILSGDGLDNVTVYDTRGEYASAQVQDSSV